MATQFNFIKKDGLIDLQGLQLLISYLTTMRNGNYRITVAQNKEKRSSKQNNWLWGVIYPVIRQALNQEGWEFTDDDQIHAFFKDRICRQEVINRDTGDVVSFPDSTSDMDTVQFSTYCQKIMDIATEYLHVDIKSLLPDPDYLAKEEAILNSANNSEK